MLRRPPLGTSLFTLLLWAATSPLQAQDPIDLTQVKTDQSVIGMAQDEAKIATRYGPGAFDFGSWGDLFTSQMSEGILYWPDHTKVVATIDPDRTLEKEYRSWMPDVFAVEGDFLTGVGLWVRCRHGYHWIAYDVPPGATRFTAQLYVSDDPGGFVYRGAPASFPVNQQFAFSVRLMGEGFTGEQDAVALEQSGDPENANDQEVFHLPQLRLNMPFGSGQKLADLDIPLPPTAQRIRFKVQASSWGDGNSNIEMILHEPRFEF